MLPRLERLLKSSEVPDRYVDRYAAAMREHGALTAALNQYRAAWLPGGGRQNGDGQVHVPTRYVWGNREVALGRRAAELSGRYVQARYVHPSKSTSCTGSSPSASPNWSPSKS